MAEALLFGATASSALVIGGTLGAFWNAPTWLTGVLLAFASGSLISALCFELFPEAADLGGSMRAGLGLVAGAAVFVAVNTLLDKYVAKSLVEESSFVLLLAILASNLPESLVGAVEMRQGGRSARFAITLWLIAAILLALAVVLGRAALGGASDISGTTTSETAASAR